MQDPTGRQSRFPPPQTQCFHLPQGATPLSDITQQVWEEERASVCLWCCSPRQDGAQAWGWGQQAGACKASNPLPSLPQSL